MSEQPPQKKQGRDVARTLVIITALLWSPLLLLAFVSRKPIGALLPLYAFAPGDITASSPNFHENLCACLAGFVYVALAVRAVRHNNKGAGILFLGMFLLSIVILMGRVLEAFGQLH